MSISQQLKRIIGARDAIRTKLTGMGLADESARIDALASAVDGIKDNGSVSHSLKSGETYIIPKGYHSGLGKVTGDFSGGSGKLQQKSATPTKERQNVLPDSGYDGLSDVTVEPIPSEYQNVSCVTADAADVLAPKVIVTGDGSAVTGTMPNCGAVSKTLTAAEKSYPIPEGYHSGGGRVNISTEDKSVTPSKSSQTVLPSDGKVLGTVTVGAIPDVYADTSDADAAAGDILLNKTAYSGGKKLKGTMKNNGKLSLTVDGLQKSFVEIPEGYTSGGTVSLTDDIETELAAL